MKIGITTSSMDKEIFGRVTGPGVYIQNLCKFLLREKKNEDIYFIHYGKSKNELYQKNEVIAPILPLRTEIFLNKIAFDVIHFNGWPYIDPKPPYRRPFWLLKANKIATIHGLEDLYLYPSKFSPTNFPKLKKFVFEKVQNKIDKIITPSYSTKRALTTYLSIDPSKIKVIYDGVGEEFHQVKNAEYILNKYKISSPFILHVSNYAQRRKNVETLLAAFYKLKKKKRIDHKLVIAGGKGDISIHEKVKKLDLGRNVLFIRKVSTEDLVALYNTADLFVFPSLCEGFGLPILEAMACGCPVISSNVSSIPEVAGKAALLLDDPLNSDEMANKIFSVLMDRERRNGLVKEGLKRVKNFSWERCAKETLKIYREIREG